MSRKIVAALFATVAYFATAYYLKISHVDEVPQRDDVAVITRLLKTGRPGTFYAHLWLPIWATRATVYEGGVSIGEANVVYDDPTRTETRDGKRWKLVEFNTKGREVRRWIIFRAGNPQQIRTP